MTVTNAGLVRIDLEIARGAAFALGIDYIGPDGEPVDTSKSQLACAARIWGRLHDWTPLAEFDDSGIVIVMDGEDTQALPLRDGTWDVIVTDENGIETLVAFGNVHVMESEAQYV